MIKRQVGNEYSAKSKAQVHSPAKSANASKGHIVMLKHEIDKHSKRDLYLVLDSDYSTQTLMIVKLSNALSGNIPVRFQPHNIAYKVKQTDIILAPNQPSNFVFATEEVYDYDQSDFVNDNLKQSRKESHTPYYPYEDVSDDDLDDDDEDIHEEENEDYSDNSSSSFDSANSEEYDGIADDEATGNNVSTTSTPSLESDHEILLEENMENREAEINNLIEDQENIVDGAAALPVEEEDVLDQSRQPKRGDIVTFVYGEMWVIGRILNKAKTSCHYNVELMDGVQINVKLRPPTEVYQDSWSLLPPEEWRPEQLRDVYTKTISRNASPILDIQRDSNPSTPHSLQLQLGPEETIQDNQVYTLPQFVDVRQPHQEPMFRITKEEYDKKYRKYQRSLNLSPDQKHLEHDLIQFNIYNDLYKADKDSLSNKFKGLFHKKKK